MRDDPELDTDERALVDKLRELPPEGNEPDWDHLAAAIRAEVGDRAPRPWWRNWRWIVPIWALATTATVALIVLRHDEPATREHVQRDVVKDAGVKALPTPAMWLDGETLLIDDVEEPALDDLDIEARAALGPDEDVTGGILPVADYGWIDTLDDEALDRAEDWLKRKRS